MGLIRINTLAASAGHGSPYEDVRTRVQCLSVAGTVAYLARRLAAIK